jgi:hypothetical protein
MNLHIGVKSNVSRTNGSYNEALAHWGIGIC